MDSSKKVEIGHGVFWCGDSLEILSCLDTTVDLILTDPPYMVSRNDTIRLRTHDISLNFGEWDYWKSEEDYLSWITSYLEVMVKVLRKGGHLVFFIDKLRLGYFADFLSRRGMIIRQPLFWIKTNPPPRMRKVSFMVSVEAALWATKETKERKYATFNFQLGQSKDYQLLPIPNSHDRLEGPRIHPTQKPVRWGAWVIKYLTNENDLVLDPFAGSGSFLLAAELTNRRWIGIEKDPGYFNRAVERIRCKIENRILL